MTRTGIASITNQDLEALESALDRGDIRDPVTDTSLQARGLGHLVEAFAPQLELGSRALAAIVAAVLSDRRQRKAPQLSLVWTGAEPGVSHSRHTRVLVSELFARARKHVLVAGYAIDSGGELFAALHQVMVEHRVTADFFIDVSQLILRLRQTARQQGKSWRSMSAPLRATENEIERGKAVVSLFFSLMWPFDGPRPVVYFDPRTAAKHVALSQHAKCIVIDHRTTLITSANFTDRGQTRNFEAGVAIEDATFAASLERQWLNLVDADVVVRGG